MTYPFALLVPLEVEKIINTTNVGAILQHPQISHKVGKTRGRTSSVVVVVFRVRVGLG